MINCFDNVVARTSYQLEKENYIVNSLLRILLANKVSQSECYSIIERLKEKVGCTLYDGL